MLPHVAKKGNSGILWYLMQMLRSKSQSTWVSVMRNLAASLTLFGGKNPQTLISSYSINYIQDLFRKILSRLIYSLIKWIIISIIEGSSLHCENRVRCLFCKLMGQTDNPMRCMWEWRHCQEKWLLLCGITGFWVELNTTLSFPTLLQVPVLHKPFKTYFLLQIVLSALNSMSIAYFSALREMQQKFIKSWMVKKKKHELHGHLKTDITGRTQSRSHEIIHGKQKERLLFVFHVTRRVWWPKVEIGSKRCKTEIEEEHI